MGGDTDSVCRDEGVVSIASSLKGNSEVCGTGNFQGESGSDWVSDALYAEGTHLNAVGLDGNVNVYSDELDVVVEFDWAFYLGESDVEVTA